MDTFISEGGTAVINLDSGNMADLRVRLQELELKALGMPEEVIQEIKGVVGEPYNPEADNSDFDFIDAANAIESTSNIVVVAVFEGKAATPISYLLEDLKGRYEFENLYKLDQSEREKVLFLASAHLVALASAKAYAKEFGKGTEKERLLDLVSRIDFERAERWKLLDNATYWLEEKDKQIAGGKGGQNKTPQETLDEVRALLLEEEARKPGKSRAWYYEKVRDRDPTRFTLGMVRRVDTPPEPGKKGARPKLTVVK